jgi:hypothetical protein
MTSMRAVMKMESTMLSGGLGSFISMRPPKKVQVLRGARAGEHEE